MPTRPSDLPADSSRRLRRDIWRTLRTRRHLGRTFPWTAHTTDPVTSAIRGGVRDGSKLIAVSAGLNRKARRTMKSPRGGSLETRPGKYRESHGCSPEKMAHLRHLKAHVEGANALQRHSRRLHVRLMRALNTVRLFLWAVLIVLGRRLRKLAVAALAPVARLAVKRMAAIRGKVKLVEDLKRARTVLDSAKIPTEGRTVYIDGKEYRS